MASFISRGWLFINKKWLHMYFEKFKQFIIIIITQYYGQIKLTLKKDT